MQPVRNETTVTVIARTRGSPCSTLVVKQNRTSQDKVTKLAMIAVGDNCA